MNKQHEKREFKSFSKANTENEKEYVGASKDGQYIDSRNGRPVSASGNTGAHEKIGGEELLYPKGSITDLYQCVGSCVVGGQIVEFWADKAGVAPSLIRIDGVIVLKSLLFGLSVTHIDDDGNNVITVLDISINDNADGGEVLITDGNIIPLILNVEDMLTSLTADPKKYFEDFDPQLYEINLSSALDIPVFVKLENVGGGGGLPVGLYEYQIRYSTKDGDRTNWSQRSVMIPVVENLSSSSDQYPWSKTYGTTPAPSSKTRYAVKIRFRVTNIYNYDFIEIKRIAHNQGAGIGFVPQSLLIGEVAISPGQIGIIDFLDPVEANDGIVLSDTKETQELAYVKKAETIRYFDKRAVLMNVELASKHAELTFGNVDGKTMFPVMDGLGKSGYNDPWNLAYRKAYMGGEVYGFGCELFDGVGGKGFVTKIPGFTSYQYPNRRDRMDTTSSDFSTASVKAAATDKQIADTFEVFDLNNSVAKTDKLSFKNISRIGNIDTSLTFGKDGAQLNEDVPDENDGAIESHGSSKAISSFYPYYHPFSPVVENDPDVTGHNYAVNTRVDRSGADIGGVGGVEYNPKGFAPNYNAHGMALASVNNFPDWCKAFSVVRTSAAKRVIAQGIGMYSLIPAEYNDNIGDMIGDEKLCTKWKKKLWFFSPDIENGVVSSDIVNDIIENPESYSIQFVSPLGFFSEVYHWENQSLDNDDRGRLVDMVSYARVLRDTFNNGSSGDAQINLGDDAMGTDGGDGYRYVNYGKWRNYESDGTPIFNSGDKGNNVFDILRAARVSEGRGTYISLEATVDVYNNESTGGVGNNNFENDGMKNFHEPFYIINIVANGASIPEHKNIEKYKSTGHYQKIDSIIGKSKGVANEVYPLVDERWEDCISALSSSAYGASTDRFIYVRKPNKKEYKLVNVTYKSAADRATIQATITGSGSWNGCIGTYTHRITDADERVVDGGRFFKIVFDQEYFPENGDLIIVKYDNTAPIKFWGGDTVVGESIFAPIDREADCNDESFIGIPNASTQFAFGIGWPYRHFKINPRYYISKSTKDNANDVWQDYDWANLGYLRQMCVMFTVESRVNIQYAHNTRYPLQYFPLVNYVIRPSRWTKDKSIVDNGIYPQYVDDYGEAEKDNWSWGGFRFTQTINPDYSNEPPKEFFSKPEFGFEEKTKFKTRIMWSLPKSVNSQNAPGLRTFPANNSFDADDGNGEIKKAYDDYTEKGSNLYAFTESGIALFITKKTILSDLDAGDIGYMAADTFIKHHIWLSKGGAGLPANNKRSAVETYVPVTAEDGSESYIKALFYLSDDGVYRFANNDMINVSGFYRNTIRKDIIEFLKNNPSAVLTGHYDETFREYWIHAHGMTGNGLVSNLLVFNQKVSGWSGKFDYLFDMFTSLDGKSYGHKNLETYELGKGFQINDQDITYELLAAMSTPVDNEFIAVKVNSDNKPSVIEFHDVTQKLCQVDAVNIRERGGFEQYIPRQDQSVSPSRKRVQGRLLLFKIIHSLAEPFKVVSAAINFKNIK